MPRQNLARYFIQLLAALSLSAPGIFGQGTPVRPSKGVDIPNSILAVRSG